MNKKITIVFVIVFIAMIGIPLVTTNLKNGTVSEAENRVLTERPHLHNGDGTLNTAFTSDFEDWFDDNVGQRSSMVLANARIQFYLFGVMEGNSDYYLGPNGELNYATADILEDYQHLNLRTDEELDEIADAYQTVSDYLDEKGIQFYYFQCWDKQSIYPEYFPRSVLQNGNVSKTDQVMEVLANQTTINLISPKRKLIAEKANYDTYSVWGNATHWSQRGAYIGYTMLMDAINENNSGKYRFLTEDDYDITWQDLGETMFGGIHKVDMEENFEIKNPQAYFTDEEPIHLLSVARSSKQIYQNDSVDNDDTLLILGDSYFENYLYDDLAESFHRVVLMRDNLRYFMEAVDYYDPTIVIVENAERCDRTKTILSIAEEIDAL